MPKIRDFRTTIETVAVASSVLDMPIHETGDLLIVFFNKDTAGSGPATPAGWSTFTANPLNSAGSGNYFFAKRAASASETLTLTYTSETSITTVISIKECFGTTVADAIVDVARAASDDSTLPFAGGSLTTTQANMLVLGFLGTDSGFGPFALPGFVNLFSGDAAANSLCLSYTVVPVAGTINHPGYWGAAADDTRWLMLSIRDSGSNTEADAYIDPNVSPATLIALLAGASAPDQGTWIAANSVELLTLAGKSVSGVAIAAAADSGNNPFHAAARHVTSSSKTALTASQLTFTAAQNLTGGAGILFGTFRAQVPRDYLDMGRATDGGAYLRLADASGNNKAWVVAGQFSVTTDPSNRQNFAIQVGQSTDTSYAVTGTLSLSAVNRLFLGGSGYYGACAVEWSALWLLNESVLQGGTSGSPIDFIQMNRAINEGSGQAPLMARIGSAATIWTRLRIGGTNPVHVNINLRTFQWPRAADEVSYLDFHVDANVLGIEFDGQSGDTIKFTNSVFTSDSPYYWRFNSGHSAAATIDFSGSTVVNATVTLRSTVALTNVSFIGCPTFTQNTADLSGCSFQNTKITSDDPSNIVNCDFTSGGTGHAIEITTPGTYTFTGNTFFGYGAGGTTDAAIYNNSGGAVTLNVGGGGSTPTIRNGAGASTTVNNNIAVTLTGMRDSTEVRVLDNSTGSFLAGTEDATDGTTDNRSFTFALAAGTVVDIAVFNLAYILPPNNRIENFTVPNADTSLPVSQIRDRNYRNN